jgi:uncharacterized protein YeaO (DUF488 family)
MISVEKSIYDPKSNDDGLRVLVMRYWPRGIGKEKVDVWLKDLGTSKELIKGWKSGKLTWSQFKTTYVADLKDKNKRDMIREIARRSKAGKLTLLCSCRDATRCHRTILKHQIERIV